MLDILFSGFYFACDGNFMLSQGWMPPNYLYTVCAMDGLSATLHVNITTVAEVEIWLSQFHSRSQMTFRVERNRLGTNPKENLFNVSIVCICSLLSKAIR